MRVVVCVKQSCKELNPFDACAVEAALRIEGAEVIAVSMGRPDVEDMLKYLTRLGVSRGILLSDRAFAGADTLATSYALSLAVQKLRPDLVLCGRQSIDGDTAQVGPGLAALLQMPVIPYVLEMSVTEKEAVCRTRLGDRTAPLPAVLTVERINELRFPKLRSKVGITEVWDAETLGADVRRCGLAGSPTKVVQSFENQSGRRHCRMISKEELRTTVENAMKTPRVTLSSAEYAGKRLPAVWAVGEKAAEKAREIADTVTVIRETEPTALLERARREKPSVILFDSSPESRVLAPQVAVQLQTGLCADCTKLETDGEQLFMYRPAFGGNIVAKIRCTTRPTMATVRTLEERCAELILAGGRGVIGQEEAMQKAARAIGAQCAASRALVDAGKAPYEWQIGLTGRTVSPQVYLAVGISGAVQHVCGMESAHTVIAVNPDKTAPIFDYADFGVCATAEEVFSLLCEEK